VKPVEQAAHDILSVLEATYQPTHDYVAADAKAFRHLDIAWYDRMTHLLSGQGYRMLADVEDRTITNTPGGVLRPVLIRAMVSRDGTVMVALYHPRLKPLLIRFLLWVLRKTPGKVVDMETECSDGTFVVTSNAASAAAIDLPALISVEYLPETTSAVDVAQRHATRLAAHLAARIGVTARVVQTHEALVASQNRLNALKAVYRTEVGGITKAELDRLALIGRSRTGDVHDSITREQLRRAG